MLCKECAQDKRIIARGLCGKCYAELIEKEKLAICVGCEELKPIKAMGMCRKCYQRFLRHSDPKKERKKKGDTLCSFCHKRPVHAKGLCGSCYSRFLKNGSPEKIKVKKIQLCKCCGHVKKIKAKGLCGACYKRAKENNGKPIAVKKKNKYRVCEFCKKIRKIKALGLCSVCYQRYQYKGSAEYSPKRKPPKPCKVEGCDKVAISYGYCDTHRKRSVNKRKDANAMLVRKYGITIDDYEEMHVKQGGVCAICGQPETVKINGYSYNLSVDHCHDTGKVRGLLCSKCNLSLGGFNDAIDLLTKAINYLTTK